MAGITIPLITEFKDTGIKQAIKEFRNLETAGEKAQFAVKKAAVPAGLAIAALGAVAFDAVKAFAEDDAAAQKLATTLGNTTGATDKQVAAVEDFITKTSMAAAVADDELRPAFDTLVRGTKDVTEAQDLLSLALDISAGTGKDLGSVSDALSKAFNGQLGPLKKLDPALAELVKSGASTDEVFAALGKTFKGQASTAANTTAGKMKNLGIQMGEFKESIGKAVAPLVSMLLPKLLQLADFVQRNSKVLVILGAIIGGIALAVIGVNAAMTAYAAITKAMTAVQIVFNAVMAINPIFLIVIAVVAIIAILVVLQKKFNIFGIAIEAIGKAFGAVWDFIKKVFNWVKDHWQLLLPIFLGPFGLVLLAVIKFKDKIIGFLQNVIGWAKDNWKLLLAIITGPFGLAIFGIIKFKDSIIGVLQGVKDFAATIFDNIIGAYRTVMNGVLGLMESGINKAITGLNAALDAVDAAAGPLVNFGNIDPVSIPRLAEGGIVDKPGGILAMIGEAGPEAVIPLNRMGSMGNTFNVYVQGADPQAVVKALQDYNRTAGPIPVNTRAN